MANYFSVMYFLLIGVLFGQTATCSAHKLYGEWSFLNVYSGRLTSIDTLTTDLFNSSYGTPKMTYLKTGKYINDQGDYTTEGNFEVDIKNCNIKTFNDNGEKGDTLTLDITYLDEQYLMVSSTETNTSYFYKRK